MQRRTKPKPSKEKDTEHGQEYRKTKVISFAKSVQLRLTPARCKGRRRERGQTFFLPSKYIFQAQTLGRGFPLADKRMPLERELFVRTRVAKLRPLRLKLQQSPPAGTSDSLQINKTATVQSRPLDAGSAGDNQRECSFERYAGVVVGGVPLGGQRWLHARTSKPELESPVAV